MTEAYPAPPVSPRRRRVLRALLAAVALVVVAAAIASRINVDYYALSPGDAAPVGPLIKVPASHSHRAHGAILLTDVFVQQLTALTYVLDTFSGNDQIVPTAALTGGGIPASELTAQGYLEMAQAKAAAKAAALRRLGYQVPERDAGVVVVAVGSGTPALHALRVGQVITAVDGVPTPNLCAFVGQMGHFGPGDTVRLTVAQDSFRADGTPVSGASVPRPIRLATRPAGATSSSGCPGVNPSRGFLGISVATQQDFSFPFPITINTADIGGPSAGLAMTLGLINTLSGGHLTAGKVVAATGTMSPTGAVGDVGGVAQKTVAVEDGGATVFLVPPQELAVARSKATASLRVYAVSSLAQALSILRELGGRVPAGPSTSP